MNYVFLYSFVMGSLQINHQQFGQWELRYRRGLIGFAAFL